MNSEPDSEEDLYSPTYAFKGVKHMVQPRLRVSPGSSWKEVRMQIDNGAAANCLRYEDYKQLADVPKLAKSSVKLTTYSGDNIIPEGQVTLDIQIGGQKLNEVLFQVIKDAPCSLLSGPTLEELGLIKVKDHLLVNAVSNNKELSKEKILAEYIYVIYRLGGPDRKIFCRGLKNGPKPKAEGRF